MAGQALDGIIDALAAGNLDMDGFMKAVEDRVRCTDGAEWWSTDSEQDHEAAELSFLSVD